MSFNSRVRFFIPRNNLCSKFPMQRYLLAIIFSKKRSFMKNYLWTGILIGTCMSMTTSNDLYSRWCQLICFLQLVFIWSLKFHTLNILSITAVYIPKKAPNKGKTVIKYYSKYCLWELIVHNACLIPLLFIVMLFLNLIN